MNEKEQIEQKKKDLIASVELWEANANPSCKSCFGKGHYLVTTVKRSNAPIVKDDKNQEKQHTYQQCRCSAKNMAKANRESEKS